MPPKPQPPPPPKPRRDVLRKRPQHRIAGIGSSPGLPQFRPSTPARDATPTPSQNAAAAGRRCTNPNCPNPKVEIADEVSWVCVTCGAIAEQDSQLVSEQQFNEERGGRITAQGQTVALDQTHQRTYGKPAGSGAVGQEPSQSLTQARNEAKTTMRGYCQRLNIPESEVEAGMAIWILAYGRKFVQGRGLSNVATVCLYLALRRRSEQILGVLRPKYPIMLIDLAEFANVDVFTLGKMYTDLVRCLYLDPTKGLSSDSLDLLAHGPEVLVDRFVDSLEFPPLATRKIKDDAIRIVSRMKRDWMSTGRRPAGVCGAAVILAARMNNHRRTTREVVLTAKVTEITLNKRLEEFSDLRSSHLSVNDFRNSQILDAIAGADPPAYARIHNPPKVGKRKRGRPRKTRAPETAAEIEGDNADQESQTREPPAKRARVDAEGFAIPDLPSRTTTAEPTTSSNGESPVQRGPGRPAGSKNWRAPAISPAEQAIEDEIQRDIDLTLEENPELDPTPVTEREVMGPDDTLPPSVRARLEEVKATSHTKGNTNTISLSPTIEASEFEDDEEVAICLLTEAERRMKEVLWVTQNADFLRQEHAKKIKRELKELELRAKGIDPASLDKAKSKKDGKWPRRKDGRPKAGRFGDVRYLHEDREARRREGTAGAGAGAGAGEGEAENGDGRATPEEEERDRTRSPSESAFPMRGAAESVLSMMHQRNAGMASRRVNWDAITNLYSLRTESSSSVSDSGSPSQARGSKASSATKMSSKERGAQERDESKDKDDQTSTPTPSPGPSTAAQAQTSPGRRSQQGSQQHTPTSTQLDDGSVEELVGSNPASRSHSDTPGQSDGLISVREDADMDDDEEDDEDEEDEDDYSDDDDDDDGEGDAAMEPDLDDVFGGRLPPRRDASFRD